MKSAERQHNTAITEYGDSFPPAKLVHNRKAITILRNISTLAPLIHE